MGYERNDRRYGYERSPEYGGRRDAGRPDYRANRDRADYGSPEERGFFERAGDEVRSWFGDEEAERRRQIDERYDERYDREGGRYARAPGGYAGPDRYPAWARSNGGEPGRNEGPRRGGFSRGYAPTSYHYARADEDRQFDDSYSRGYGETDWADTGYAYGDDRARRNVEYRAYYGAGNRGRDNDPHGYGSWREQQLASFDRDYDEYRRENQSRFESEFSTWRQNRQTQRDSLTQAKEHQEVVGSDGVHVGKVDHVRGDRILLAKNDRDAGGHHHSIPSAWIATVGEKVQLSKTAAQAQQAWRDEERNSGLFERKAEDRKPGDGADRDAGTGGLNRSFSGTY